MQSSDPNGLSKTLWVSAMVFLVLQLYFGAFVKLVHDWYTLPDFSHGLLVPFVVAYLVWKRRARFTNRTFSGSWKGLYLLLPGLMLLLVGELGADLFLIRVSFPVSIAGAVWLLAGGSALRDLRFPICVMFLGIPLPQVVFNQITLPLQLLASSIAGTMLPLFHIPVFRSGNIIQLPSVKLEVAEACSGIRSLMSLFSLAALYVYTTERSVTRRLLLLLSTIPIAVFANALRIVGTGILAQTWNPEGSLGFFHEFSGVVLFGVTLAMLFAIQQALRWAAGPDWSPQCG